MKLPLPSIVLCCFLFFFSQAYAAVAPAGIVVLQTDFGLKDGAVNAMKGVIYNVDKSLIVSDLTHEIPPYHIWEASYRLGQVTPFWPKGTVFVSVVDPGVGTNRRSIVAESKNGYYFVTPDNGTLTTVADKFELKEVRQIDETKNRLPGSSDSHTFHGRDVYGYTGARLAAGIINFEQVGPSINQSIVKLTVNNAFIKNNKLYGTIVVLDPEYGNLWTNINDALAKQYQIKTGQLYKIKIYHNAEKKYEGTVPFQKTFGAVKKGKNLTYINSLMNLALGVNQGNFAQKYHIGSGPEWHIEISKFNKF